ncbi:uncharacterized protein [Magallana gigas]|uniref:uncharacterized protein n=1 Tax=Magallana gigas TaxID=29159 RepID=UPI003340A3D3
MLQEPSYSKRFKSVSDAEIQDLKERRQSKATKSNTKWGLNLFQEWSVEALGQPTNFHSISAPELNSHLEKFYAEDAPRPNEKRSQSMTKQQASEYHNNTFKSIRSALNRHIYDIGRQFDIVRDREFRESNNVLDGKLKKNLQDGLSRPIKHKEIIPKQDLDANENPKEKRMYEVPSAGAKCPVASLKLYLSKLDPKATFLFNRCSKEALKSPTTEEIWYTDVPIKKYQFTRFMADICKNAKCSKTYTAHNLRATSIQGMNDAGFEVRHIMHMSGHKNESSVRSYSRNCSTY